MFDSFATAQVATAPRWLSRAVGQSWNDAVGLFKDGVFETATRAVLSRFATRAAGDALPVIAEDRDLEWGWDETEENARGRLRRGFTLHRLAGTRPGLELVLKSSGYPNAYVVSRRQWAPPGSRAHEYVIVLYPPFPWNDVDFPYDGLWCDPGTWDDGGVWGGAMPEMEQRRIERILEKWSPVHAVCATVFVCLEGTVVQYPERALGNGEFLDAVTMQWTPGVARYA